MKQEIDSISWLCSQVSGGRRILFKKYLLKMADSIIDLFLTLIIGLLIEAIFYRNNLKLFIIESIVYIVLFLLKCIVGKIVLVTVNQLQENILLGLRKLMFEKTMKANANDLNELNSGEFLQMFGQDVEDIFTCFNDALEKITVSVFQIFIIFMIVAYYSFALAVVILCLSLVTVKLTSFSGKKFQEYRSVFRKKQGEYIDWINEHLKGMRDIRINQSQLMMADIFENKTVQNLKDKEKIRFIEIRSERIVGFITAIFTVIFWTVSALMIFNGILTVGIFYVTNKYFSNLISNLSTIGQEKINIRNYMPGFEKIRDILGLKEEEGANKRNKSIDGNQCAELKFNGVTFGYGKKKVIRDLNMAFKPGKMYVIVGANGEGKTTLMNLILRFYDVDGTITFNGEAIGQYPLKWWRKHIGFLQQHNIIFEGSLRDNILLYAPDKSETEIWDILKMAGMYDTVKEWEEGIDTNLLCGARLSEGQKQRIAIARILARDPDIILMDEPTAAVDEEIEKLIISDIKEMYKNKILIIITHRIAVAKQADIVMVMKEGNICNYGKHEALLKESSDYRSLFGL